MASIAIRKRKILYHETASATNGHGKGTGLMAAFF
jgi:hypothetical protein